jgi:SecD/SecF fusion protein
MKTILYMLIAIILFGSIATGYSYKTNNKISIRIESIDKFSNSELLAQSAGIIENRLRDFGSEKFVVETIPGRGQIKVTFLNSGDITDIENLIIEKGKLEFYETYNYMGLNDILPHDNHLLTYFGSIVPKDSSPVIGCIAMSKVDKINGYLDSITTNHRCKFAWDRKSEITSACLYALRTVDTNGPVLNGSDIEKFKFNQDSSAKFCWIEIKFKKSAVELWTDITKRNLNNAIALILDNNVLSAPIVRSVIEGGSSQITGDFKLKDVKYIAAIGNNGELPLSFKVVK